MAYMGKTLKTEWVYVYVSLMHSAVHLKLTQHFKSTIYSKKEKDEILSLDLYYTEPSAGLQVVCW